MKRTSVCGREAEHAITAQRAKEEILGDAEVEKISNLFRVLADPTRMKIVLALLNGEMCVYHLTEVCDGTQSGISHQLRILRNHNIVTAKRMGQTVEYSLADEHVVELLKMSIAHLACEGE